MKAIFAGGSHHNSIRDITNANPTLPMTPLHGSKEKEIYSLFEVKNKDGAIFVLYQLSECKQSEKNEILLQFN